MKAKNDPRHQKRVEIMKNLYAYSFDPNTMDNPQLVKSAISHLSTTDQLIHLCAPEWPLEQINRIDLAILRMSITELTLKDTPYKVVIDESVELAKEYGSENSSKFVNGVLGAVIKQVQQKTLN
jgi:N utilization substance protein B